MTRWTFGILMMIGFSLMLGLGVISPFLPVLAGGQRANGLWIGVIFSGFGISRGLIMPLVGKLSDRKGRRIFMVSGLFLFTVVSFFYPWARNVWTLTLVRAVHGLAAGMIMPIMFAYLGEVAEEGKEAVIIGAVNMAFYLGLAAGPFLGGIINQYWGFDMIFYTIGGISAFTFLAAFFFLPETKVSRAEKPNEFRFSEIIKYNFIRAVLIITVITTLVTIVYVSFVPSLAAKNNIDTEHIGFIVSIGIFLAGILQIPFGKIADKLNKARRSYQVSIGTAIGMLALLAMPFCSGYAGFMIAGAFVGIGAAVSTPALMSLAIGIGRKTSMGAWMGVMQSSKSIAFIVSPLVFGIVMDRLGIDAVFYLMTMICFFGGAWYLYYIHRRIRGYKQG